MLDFTKEELRNLTIAFVVLTFCFGIATAGLNAHGIISILPIVVVSVVIGSLLHELGHKFVAMKYGCQAEFKLWPLGLLIAVITSFFGFVFFAPQLRRGGDHAADADRNVGVHRVRLKKQHCFFRSGGEHQLFREDFF